MRLIGKTLPSAKSPRKRKERKIELKESGPLGSPKDAARIQVIGKVRRGAPLLRTRRRRKGATQGNRGKIPYALEEMSSLRASERTAGMSGPHPRAKKGRVEGCGHSEENGRDGE